MNAKSFLIATVTGILMTGVAMAQATTAPATTAPAPSDLTQDFTKDLGQWKIISAEAKVEKDGLKFSKLDQFGGIYMEGMKVDLSGAEAITVELQNTSDKPMGLVFKIGSGGKKVSDDFTVEAGKSMTYTRALGNLDINLKQVDYVKIFALEAGPGNLTIKRIAVVKGSGKPITTAPAGEPFSNDFTKSMGKWTLPYTDYTFTAGGEGLKITNLGEMGGLMQTPTPTNLKETPVVEITLKNAAKEAVSLTMKVKGGGKAGSKDLSVEAGEQTVKVDLSDLDADVTKIDYMKLFGSGKVDLTIKKIAMTKAK